METPVKSGGDDTTDRQVRLILKDAGLESSPIDEASLRALKDYVANSTPLSKPQQPSREDEPPPLRDVDIYGSTLSRGVSDLSKPPPTAARGHTIPAISPLTLEGGLATPASVGGGGGEVASNATTAGSSRLANDDGEQPPQSKEDRILEQLQLQTTLLLDLQQRVDELTRQVQARQGTADNGVAGSTSWTSTTRASPTSAGATTTHPAAPRVAAAAAAEPDAPRAVPEPHNNNNNGPDVMGRVVAIVADPFGVFDRTRVGKVIKLYTILRRREVPNLQAGLILKVLVMLAILMGRFSQHQHRMEGSADFALVAPKFYLLVALIVGGFLFQTGYVQFVYRFFVKENYPSLIFSMTAEELDDLLARAEREGLAPPAAPARGGRPQPRQPPPPGGLPAPNNNNAPRPPRPPHQQEQEPLEEEELLPGWRETLIGGQIARGGGENQPRGVLGFFQEIILLLGSFFLSIFPFWQPEAAAHPQPQGGDGRAAGADLGGGAGGPGAVRPPNDPAEEDSSEEEEEEDDDGFDEPGDY